MKNIVLSCLSLLNIIYPKSKNKILFISSPDLTDNSFALFKFLVESKDKNYNYIWLIDNIQNKELYMQMIQKNMTINSDDLEKIKILDKKSIIGMMAYIQTKYIFFTHGFYTGISLPKNQFRINLWHGMPLKTIGYLNKNSNNRSIPKSSIVISTSLLYQNIMKKVFNMDNKKILITGQPRCDLLISSHNILKKLAIEKEKYRKIILWTPTYRHAKDHDIKDGIFTNTLPILKENDLELLNHYLNSINVYMLVKLHPMDMLNLCDFKQFTNIRIIKDDVLLKKGIQLYSLLSEIDILVTDFSSIYIDFLLLDRPIIFALDDFASYKKSRDFVFESPKAYMPGPIVSNIKLFIKSLNDIIIENKDIYCTKRERIQKKFHTYENAFSERLIKILEI